ASDKTTGPVIAAPMRTDSLAGPTVDEATTAPEASGSSESAPPTGDAMAQAAEGDSAAFESPDAASLDLSEAPQPEIPVETLGGDDYEQRPRRSPPPRQ